MQTYEHTGCYKASLLSAATDRRLYQARYGEVCLRESHAVGGVPRCTRKYVLNRLFLLTHRVTQLLRLEGIHGGHLVQLPTLRLNSGCSGCPEPSPARF